MSLAGAVGKISSFGSTTLTLSGSGFFGPVFPFGSQGSIIFTFIPNTPVKEIKTYYKKKTFILCASIINTKFVKFKITTSQVNVYLPITCM